MDRTQLAEGLKFVRAAEFEREGIAIAKGEGKYLAHRSLLTDDQVQSIHSQAAAGERKAAKAHNFGISRETPYQKLRDAVVVAN